MHTLILFLALQPLNYQQDLSSKSFKTRINAVQKVSELSGFALIGLEILAYDKDAQVQEFALKELQLRYDLIKRKKVLDKINKFINKTIIPEPKDAHVFAFYKNMYDKHKHYNIKEQYFRDALYDICSSEISNLEYLILGHLFSTTVIDLEEYLRKVIYFSDIESLNKSIYYVLIRHLEGNDKFWVSLIDIVDNNLFFKYNMKDIIND
jgi:hypothetical protein